MMNYTEQFSKWFDENGIQYVRLNDVLWREYRRMIVPVGPASDVYQLDGREVKILFRSFPSAVMCRLTRPSENQNLTDGFYAVICKEFKDYDLLQSKRKSEIIRGLKNCRAEIVDPALISEQAYDVYCKAAEKYNEPPVQYNTFAKEFFLQKNFDDIVHFWGVFHENQLIAYAKVYVYGSVEANITVAKFDPGYLHLYPAYAMFYTMNELYLHQGKVQYVNDGFRSLQHNTNIQDFLIRKFGYEKYFVDVTVRYRQPFGIVLKMLRPFKGFMCRIHPGFDALYKLHDISGRQNKRI